MRQKIVTVIAAILLVAISSFMGATLDNYLGNKQRGSARKSASLLVDRIEDGSNKESTYSIMGSSYKSSKSFEDFMQTVDSVANYKYSTASYYYGEFDNIFIYEMTSPEGLNDKALVIGTSQEQGQWKPISLVVQDIGADAGIDQ